MFEICLTSNLQTRSVPSAQQHPIQKFLDEQLRVALNTDDPGISNITLTDEFELVACEFRMSDAHVRELLVHAVRAAFVEPSERARIELLVRGEPPPQ